MDPLHPEWGRADQLNPKYHAGAAWDARSGGGTNPMITSDHRLTPIGFMEMCQEPGMHVTCETNPGNFKMLFEKTGHERMERKETLDSISSLKD